MSIFWETPAWLSFPYTLLLWSTLSIIKIWSLIHPPAVRVGNFHYRIGLVLTNNLYWPEFYKLPRQSTQLWRQKKILTKKVAVWPPNFSNVVSLELNWTIQVKLTKSKVTKSVISVSALKLLLSQRIYCYRSTVSSCEKCSNPGQICIYSWTLVLPLNLWRMCCRAGMLENNILHNIPADNVVKMQMWLKSMIDLARSEHLV